MESVLFYYLVFGQVVDDAREDGLPAQRHGHVADRLGEIRLHRARRLDDGRHRQAATHTPRSSGAGAGRHDRRRQAIAADAGRRRRADAAGQQEQQQGRQQQADDGTSIGSTSSLE